MERLNEQLIWKDSKELAVKVYMITGKGKFLDDDSIRDQIRRSVVNISSNIAEGEESESTKGSIQHFSLANIMIAGLRSQIEIARDIGYIKARDYIELNEYMAVLSKRLYKLIQYRQSQLRNRP